MHYLVTNYQNKPLTLDDLPKGAQDNVNIVQSDFHILFELRAH